MAAGAKEACPRCGWETSRMDLHEDVCARIPLDIVEIFFNEKLFLSELAKRYDIGSGTLKKTLLRAGVSNEKIYDHLDAVGEERGIQHRRRKKERDNVEIIEDEQCDGCGIVLWNDPRDVPDILDDRIDWHINYGGYCCSCAKRRGQVWEWNATLLLSCNGHGEEKTDVEKVF